MKPRTQFEKRVYEAMESLRPLTDAQTRWAYSKVFNHYAYRRGNGKTYCMDCGHEFKTDKGATHCTCPSCGESLEIKQTRGLLDKQRGYFNLTTTAHGMQVVRYFFISRYFHLSRPYNMDDCYEVAQRWIGEDGTTAYCSLKRQPFGWYVDSFCRYSSIELRPLNKGLLGYLDSFYTYPRMSLIPALKRNGIGGSLHDVSPADLFEAILTEPRIETLFKAKQFSLVQYFTGNQRAHIDDYWPAIKIAIRNNYTIKEAALWKDYIDALIYLGKDIHNAVYVCPADFQTAHDRYIALKVRKEEEERIKSDIERAKKDEKAFQNMKSRFFGLTFTDGLINVHVLESIREYAEEGAAMHHCVFSNGYYKKPSSLILSATIEGKRIETIEVSLNTLKILQCFGACNQFTEYHERIKSLVSKNAHLIGQRLKKAC